MRTALTATLCLVCGAIAAACGTGESVTGTPAVASTTVTTAITPPVALADDSDTDGFGSAHDRSETGAADFGRQLVWFGQMLMYSPAPEALALTGQNTTPAGYEQVRDLILNEVGPLRERLAELPAGPLWWTTAPLSHRLVAYSADQATVEVWSVTVVAREGFTEPTANYTTATFDLVWEDDRWLLDGFSDVLGPAPDTEFTAPRAVMSDFTAGLEGHSLGLPPIFRTGTAP